MWQPLVNLNSYASMKAVMVDSLMITVDQTDLSLEWQGRNSQVCIVGLVWLRAILKNSRISSQRNKFIFLMQFDNLINKIY